MTDLMTPPASARARSVSGDAGHNPSSPIGRRAERPRWRDTRLLLGVLLIIISVVVGARFVGGATRTVQWLSVTRALPAGHVLTASDLTPTKAHLAASAGRQYFRAPAPVLVGRTLARSMSSGELLPADALASGSAPASRVVPLLVKAGRLPLLVAGDHVDVYVLSVAAGAASGREVRVLTDVEFIAQDVVGSGDASLQLRVTPAEAIAAVAASQSNRVDVVRVDRDASSSPGEAGPSSVPAYDGS
jgi:hypothetical protein